MINVKINNTEVYVLTESFEILDEFSNNYSTCNLTIQFKNIMPKINDIVLIVTDDVKIFEGKIYKTQIYMTNGILYIKTKSKFKYDNAKF